jgi:hypothetical protein
VSICASMVTPLDSLSLFCYRWQYVQKGGRIWEFLWSLTMGSRPEVRAGGNGWATCLRLRVAPRAWYPPPWRHPRRPSQRLRLRLRLRRPPSRQNGPTATMKRPPMAGIAVCGSPFGRKLPSFRPLFFFILNFLLNLFCNLLVLSDLFVLYDL